MVSKLAVKVLKQVSGRLIGHANHANMKSLVLFLIEEMYLELNCFENCGSQHERTH